MAQKKKENVNEVKDLFGNLLFPNFRYNYICKHYSVEFFYYVEDIFALFSLSKSINYCSLINLRFKFV